MTLRQLELFLALVKNPHLSQLATENGLTQSAVSMAVKSLEDSLEKKLFDRINKKLVLNENGRFFYRMVEPLVLGLKESEILFKDNDLRGDLKVAASSSIANYILPQIIYEFIEQYKGVRIKKITCNTQEVARLIETNEVDIGFVEGECTGRYIQKDFLGADELYVVTGDKELARKHEYRMEELLSKRWIFREKGSGTRDVFLNHIGEHKKRLKAYMELDHAEAIKSVLHNTDAISCLSRVSVRRELAASQLFRLKIQDIGFTRSFYTIWHEHKYFSSVLQEFVYFSKEAYKTLYGKKQ
ncbi:MAG: LysR family transcriptional regulator [Desulfobacterium sp.]|nr:LysR family transcriptional regulator [Desulfobacterium sp.]